MENKVILDLNYYESLKKDYESLKKDYESLKSEYEYLRNRYYISKKNENKLRYQYCKIIGIIQHGDTINDVINYGLYCYGDDIREYFKENKDYIKRFEVKKMNKDLIYIKKFSKIKITYICKELNIDVSNLLKGTCSKDKIKLVREELEKKVKSLGDKNEQNNPL